MGKAELIRVIATTTIRRALYFDFLLHHAHEEDCFLRGEMYCRLGFAHIKLAFARQIV